MAEEKIYLIRKGGEVRDKLREVKLRVSPPATSAFIPPVFATKPVVVPRGAFAAPIDMHGKILEAKNRETGGEVRVYPEFRLLGVEEGDGGLRLAEALFHHHEEQLPEIMRRLDGIFRAQLGMRSTVEDFERLATANSAESESLRRQITSELGLLVDWTLSPEPKAAQWIQKLITSTPKSKTLSYNAELPSTEFKLTFTVTVQRANLQYAEKVRQRAEKGVSPEQELENITQRVYDITNPAFRAIWTGINVWNADIVRELAIDGFASVVAKRLAEEFGYEVKFSEFTPEPNEAMVKALRELAPQEALLEDYANARKVVKELKAARTEALISSDGDYDEVAKLDESIKRAEAEVKEAEKARLSGDQEQVKMLESSSDAASEGMREKFKEALLLEDSVTRGSKDRKYQPPKDRD